jgi:hypothetical protein
VTTETLSVTAETLSVIAFVPSVAAERPSVTAFAPSVATETIPAATETPAVATPALTAVLTGLASGTKLWFRVRAVGGNNAPGAWTRSGDQNGAVRKRYLLGHFYMSDTNTPRPYEEWRADSADRGEDAAYTFGYYLIQHCRAEVLKQVQSAPVLVTRKQFQKHVEAAVDRTLCSVMDLLEGYWRADAGPKHTAEFVLSVRVMDANRKEVEHVDISPCLLDLPIGYWKWKDGGFR